MTIVEFLKWYYYHVPKDLFTIWGNFLRFFYHFFGIPYHLATLFRPWHLIVVRFEEEDKVKAFFYNVASRIIGSVMGMIVRLITIFAGFIGIVLAFIVGILIPVLWFALPFLMVIGLAAGFWYKPIIGIGVGGGEALLALVIGEMFLYQKVARARNENTLRDEYIRNKLGFDYHKDHLLDENNISKEDIAYLGEWFSSHYEEESLKGRFWRREWQDRVVPIGIDWASGYTPTLDVFSRPSIRERFSQNEHFFLFTFKREIEAVERILAQEGRNNVLLVGEEGVGKHFILSGLEKLINTGRALPSLAFKRFVRLEIDAILSGIKTPGELRERLKNIFAETVRAGNIVLVIERIHTFFDPVFPEIPDILLPFLQSEYSQVIATTTPGFIATSSLNRSDIVSQFARVNVEEVSLRHTFFILQEASYSIEQKGNIRISYGSLKKIVDMADRFIMDIPRPQKDIDLLEETVSFVTSKGRNTIEIEDIEEMMSGRTGIPLGALGEGEKEKLLRIEETLHKKLIDQVEAVSTIGNALKRAGTGVRQISRPIGTFLFLGPTGVGKTTAAKALAELYFGSSKAMIRFDMSEYQNASDTDRLIENLSRDVKQRPYTLLLLDEIEKAYPKILNVFLQALDEGVLMDLKGSKVNFQNLIIIGTSNAGAEFIRTHIEQVGTDAFEQDLLDFLQENAIFTPEFLNRFDAVITFKPLSKKELEAVAGILLEEVADALKKEHNITFIVSDELKIFLADKGFDPQYGARPMRRILQEKIETLIAERLLREEIKKGDTIEINISDIPA